MKLSEHIPDRFAAVSDVHRATERVGHRQVRVDAQELINRRDEIGW